MKTITKTQLTCPDSSIVDYTYDNGSYLTISEAKDGYTYNQANQLTQSLRAEGEATSYQYDKNGNLTKKTETDDDTDIQTYTYTYDYENRLIKVVKQESRETKTISFKYDPFGRRIEKKTEETEDDETETKTYTYIYDNEDIILEYLTKTQDNETNTQTTKYIHGHGIDEPLAIERKSETYYYHADGLGSITTLTDKRQKTVESYTYLSFGELKRKGDKVKNTFTFTGREYDKETGLYYYRARYYDARVGRLLTKDPIDFRDGSNVYTYVDNQPINYTDAYGFLNPKGSCKFGLCIYTEEDYQDGKNALKDELKRRYPWMSDKDADKMADDIMQEMSIPEAQRLKDYGRKDKQQEAEDLIREICERTGANCLPEEPKDNGACEQGQ